MSVAVTCNLSDGVILGVDSAVTVPSGAAVAKVYENAEKLFQLGKKPVGVAFFGLGGLAARSLGSYLREFELKDPNGVVGGNCPLSAVVEALRDFFCQEYSKTVVPAVEATTKEKWDKIPPGKKPSFGLAVGGFSNGAYLSEVWHITIPLHEKPNSAELTRPQGQFGTNWFAMFGPIQRYIKGFDAGLLNEVGGYIVRILGRPLSQTEQEDISKILLKHEYQIPFGGMPMEEGIKHTRFLVELVIQHHRFAVGAPVVGGRTKIGKVTYRGDDFAILDS